MQENIITDEIYMNRPTKALISIPNLRNNLSIAKKLISSNDDKDHKIMAVVKANAYGHGIYKISKELSDLGVEYLAVAYLEEGIFLRKCGLDKIKILVLGAVDTSQIEDYIKYNIEITTSSISKSIAISEAAKKMNRIANIHIKIDTGMERIGVHWYNAISFIKQTYSLTNLSIEGIFSHFAKSDEVDDLSFTNLQIQRFDGIIDHLKDILKFDLPKFIHISNSSGLINNGNSSKSVHSNLTRIGLMLYGYGNKIDFGDKIGILKPVMSLISEVSYFKVAKKDSGISYNLTGVLKEQSRIATLPIGYGDGYNRLLSNEGEVIIRGEKYKVIGNICMDQTMINLGPDGTAYNGDIVLLFGEYDSSEIRLESLCKKIDTIPYEILCNINYRVPRKYIY